MTILVIASIRSGGRYFTKQLSLEYNLKHYHEPNQINNIDLSKDVVVKLVTWKPWNYDVSEICEYANDFNKVFILDRRDKQLHLESVFNLYEYSKNMGAYYTWNSEKFNKSNPEHSKQYYIEWLNRQSKCLNEVSSELNIPITYYEDLYYDNSKVDLQGLSFKPNLSKKLRKETLKNTNFI